VGRKLARVNGSSLYFIPTPYLVNFQAIQIQIRFCVNKQTDSTVVRSDVRPLRYSIQPMMPITQWPRLGASNEVVNNTYAR
jgi:hypothetical protein